MVWPLRYLSSEEVLRGDRIKFALEAALVEHVVPPETHESEGWRLAEGGFVILTASGQRFALDGNQIDMEDIEFVMRAENDPDREWQRDWSGPQMGGRETGEWRLL